MRSIKGRAWIEAPKRLPLAERAAAETHAAYGAKTYTVSSPAQKWKVRPMKAPDKVGLAWLEGTWVVVLDADSHIVGSCTPISPHVSIPGITLPMILTVRAMGTLD